jgi:hypothetical protein
MLCLLEANQLQDYVNKAAYGGVLVQVQSLQLQSMQMVFTVLRRTTTDAELRGG